MTDDMYMDDEQSGQETDPNQDPTSNPQRTGDPQTPLSNQPKDPSIDDQSVQSDRGVRNNPSDKMHIGDLPRASVMARPVPTQDLSKGDLPGMPRPSEETETSWFTPEEQNELHSRWTTIQIQFVEDPCNSVEQGEAMVAETVERVKEMISKRVQEISDQWLNHDQITTEELRVTLVHYRSLLDRMLKL